MPCSEVHTKLVSDVIFFPLLVSSYLLLLLFLRIIRAPSSLLKLAISLIQFIIMQLRLLTSRNKGMRMHFLQPLLRLQWCLLIVALNRSMSFNFILKFHTWLANVSFLLLTYNITMICTLPPMLGYVISPIWNYPTTQDKSGEFLISFIYFYMLHLPFHMVFHSTFFCFLNMECDRVLVLLVHCVHRLP